MLIKLKMVSTCTMVSESRPETRCPASMGTLLGVPAAIVNPLLDPILTELILFRSAYGKYQW